MITNIKSALQKIPEFEGVKTTIIPVRHSEVLIIQRDKLDSHPNLWEFPGGGVDIDIQNEKDIFSEALRELLEETSLSVKRISFLGLKSFINSEGNSHANFGFIAEIYDLRQVVLSNEHQDYRILGFHQAKTMLFFENQISFMDDLITTCVSI